MFRALLCPSSGARHYNVDYHIGRLVPWLLVVGCYEKSSGLCVRDEGKCATRVECVTNRKVAGSIQADVIGIFH